MRGKYAKLGLLAASLLVVGLGIGGGVLALRSNADSGAIPAPVKPPTSPALVPPQGAVTGEAMPPSSLIDPAPLSADTEESGRASASVDAVAAAPKAERINSVQVPVRGSTEREPSSPRVRNSPQKEVRADSPEPPPPAPSVSQETPLPVDSTPESEPSDLPASSDRQAIEQFNEMNDVIVSVESFSGQALKAYEAEGRGGELEGRLRSFNAAAVSMRKEFRKATGTGIAGLKSNLRGLFRRSNSGREVDTRILRIKVQELIQSGVEVDGLIEADPPGTMTINYWQEVRQALRRLAKLF